jgi:hypothetical protein
MIPPGPFRALLGPVEIHLSIGDRKFFHFMYPLAIKALPLFCTYINVQKSVPRGTLSQIAIVFVQEHFGPTPSACASSP